jgi:hypothetical protein
MSHRPYCGSELGGSCTCGKPKDAHTGWQDKLDAAARLLTEIIDTVPAQSFRESAIDVALARHNLIRLDRAQGARRSGAGHGKAS